MNTKLNHIRDWSELARQANWSVAKMAQISCVSENTLRRHFIRNMGANPSQWIAQRRLQEALDLLQKGLSVKETAAQLGSGAAV